MDNCEKCRIINLKLNTGPCAICKSSSPDRQFVRFECNHKYHKDCWITAVLSMFSNNEKQMLEIIDTQLMALLNWINDPTSTTSQNLVSKLNLNGIFNPAEATKKKMEQLKRRFLARRALLFGRCPCCKKETFPIKFYYLLDVPQ